MDDHAVLTTTQPAACACAQPVPEVRATRKGAARTHCARCGQPLRLAFDLK
jgi:predicted SprT family Zn-dependent metalloprotease